MPKYSLQVRLDTLSGRTCNQLELDEVLSKLGFARIAPESVGTLRCEVNPEISSVREVCESAETAREPIDCYAKITVRSGNEMWSTTCHRDQKSDRCLNSEMKVKGSIYDKH